MKDRAPQINQKRHTRIRVSTIERLIIWHVPQNDTNIALECPHCGAEVFWIEVDQTECQVQHEEHDFESED